MCRAFCQGEDTLGISSLGPFRENLLCHSCLSIELRKQTNKANREALAVFHASWLLGLANHEWPQLARLVHVYGKEDGHVHVALLPTVSCSAPFAKESQVHQHSKFPMQKSLRGSPAIFLKAVFPVPGCLQPHFRPKRLFR